MKEVMCLEGPVMRVNGELVLFVPICAGGEELAECACGFAEVQGEFLKISIPPWIAGLLRIEEGDLVCVRNGDGRFHIGPSNARCAN